MRFHRLSFIALLIPFVGAGVALGDVASTSNRADLVAESIGIDDAGSIVAVVANRGTAVTTSFVVEVELDGHTRRTLTFGAGMPAGRTALGAKPGAGRNLMLPFQQNEKRTLRVTGLNAGICSGSHTLKLRVDAGAVIKEANENNNEVARALAAPCPDLAVASIKKNYNRTRTQYVAEVVVVNQGTGTTPHFSVATQATAGTGILTLPDGGATQYPALAPGQTLKLRTGVAHAFESLRVKVWLDVGNVVKEANEANNVVEKLLTP